MFEPDAADQTKAPVVAHPLAVKLNAIVDQWFGDVFAGTGPEMTPKLHGMLTQNRESLKAQIVAALK